MAVSSVGTNVEATRHCLIQWLQKSFTHKWEPFKLVQKFWIFISIYFHQLFACLISQIFPFSDFFTTGKNHLHSNVLPVLHWILPVEGTASLLATGELLKGAQESSLLFVLFLWVYFFCPENSPSKVLFHAVLLQRPIQCSCNFAMEKILYSWHKSRYNDFFNRACKRKTTQAFAASLLKPFMWLEGRYKPFSLPAD